MRFHETREGDYRIYAGALEARRGQGWTAALVVDREGDPARGERGERREAFRDDSLACGYRWPTPDEALRYAVSRARELIRSRSQQLAC
ncbi:MAG: hypothetical protein KF683_11325 [Rubrivivax sp.]|nr:hypothetical protein [Rubrivivax sp.]